MFGRGGYRGTGVAAIAEHAGITPSAVIHHFGSKDALLQAVLDEYDRQSIARVTRHLDGTVQGLVDALLADAAHLSAHPGLGALHMVLQAEHLVTDSPVQARFRNRARVLREQVSSTLDVPDATALELLAFLEGALTVWLLDPETVDLVALYRGYLGRLFPGTV
ncbi:TetR/AcrR family transcriptional regulator [Actinokineospora sp. HUAS TT18]|uniref:TetR/AcrR family transcriptional regulator n=1 Tax=Actinokineospora sp. HUAS TT18 TaxID=3447451 RepID=UPI003F5222F9